jgi:hypothetical protein
MHARNLGLGVGLVGWVLVGPAVAAAIGISIVEVASTGGDASVLRAGDLLTVDLVVQNEEQLDLYGVGLLAFGYDADRNGTADDGLELVGIHSSGSLFNTTSVGSGAVGGLQLHPAYANPREVVYPISEWPAGVVGHERVGRLFGGISLSPSNGDGSLDIGVDGDRISAGGAHFRVAFRATAGPAAARLQLGFGIGSASGVGERSRYGEGVVGTGGVMHPFVDAFHEVTIVANPEPGTALLIGLGLFGLAAARSRAHGPSPTR